MRTGVCVHRLRFLLACLGMLLLMGVAGCLRPAQQRAESDLRIGKHFFSAAALEVIDGLATVHQAEAQHAVLWAQAPEFELTVDSTAVESRSFAFTVRNAMPALQLAAHSLDGSSLAVTMTSDLGSVKTWRLWLPPAQSRLRFFAPPSSGPFQIAVFSDIHNGIGQIDDFFVHLEQHPEVRFVLCAGDVSDSGDRQEFEAVQQAFLRSPVPIFTTAGNHDIRDSALWAEMFGRHSFHFAFQEVHFTLLDTSSATIDPLVFGWLQQWGAAARERDHIVVSHIPPFDQPLGARNSSFRSHQEAATYVAELIEAKVDAAFYGHIHSYAAFSHGRIPAYITGGVVPGWHNGIGRHFLIVEFAPESSLRSVDLVHVD